MSNAQLAVSVVAGFGALALFGLGAAFWILPAHTLAVVDHTSDGLPQVMGGRYAFMGLLLAAASYLRDWRMLAIVFAGFAFLGFVDAVIYAAGNYLPHVAAGLISGLICVLCVRAGREE